MNQLKGVAIGAGYFSHFHYDGWSRIPEVKITAVCDMDQEKAQAAANKFDIDSIYADFNEMIDNENPDFVDVITPPATHLELCTQLAERGITIICQKPLAPIFDEAKQIVDAMQKNKVRFAVHENWRFQPWYREIKKLLDDETIGDLHSIYFRSRMGDGWGENAYLDRQPYFREYPRLLLYENGVHFIDTFRYLSGEIKRVFSSMRKLNPVTKGEDRCIIYYDFVNGAEALWDANRYNESNQPNPRYTFGECLVEGTGGSIRLYSNGDVTVQKLGEPETKHEYFHEDRGFAGDCAYYFERHFADCMLNNQPFETNGENYLKTLQVQEAVYASADQGIPKEIS